MSFTDTQRPRRGHAFLPPKAIRTKTPALYATDGTPLDAKVLCAKWFLGGWTWYACEADWDTGECFGYVEAPGGSEWGYFNLVEMEAVKAQGWLVIERDKWFDPTTFSALVEAA